MCGIAGIFAYRDGISEKEIAELERIRDHMSARGPDGRGIWISRESCAGFAHRRLSIVDLSDDARQPMQSADGSLIVTFNGEIYNYRELRKQLENIGYIFKTTSDTEVLLYLYKEFGPAMPKKLRGMFAFAIWDENQKTLFLARDPYGIKPLYICHKDSKFRFASQVKALVEGNGLPYSDDPAGWVGFLLFGSVPEPFTTFKEIQAFPPGCYMIIGANGSSSECSFSDIKDIYFKNNADPEVERDAAEKVRAALVDSVRAHMVADVEVGCFLSAGIDSSSLLGLMSQATSATVKAITLGFDEFASTSNDEVRLARKVSEAFGADHYVRIVGEREFREDIPQIFKAMDQPSIDGVNTWFVSKAASEIGLKVAVSGIGGDELFGGYNTFGRLQQWSGPISSVANSIPLSAASHFFVRFLHQKFGFGNPKLPTLLKFGKNIPSQYFVLRGLYMPSDFDDLSRVFDQDFLKLGLAKLNLEELLANATPPSDASLFSQVSILESGLYLKNQLLRDCDWASMAHSLEVRTPLVDYELLSRVGPLFRTPGKEFLALAPKNGLPPDVTARPKTGFSTPVNRWVSQSLNNGISSDPMPTSPLNAIGSRTWALEIAKLWRNFAPC